VSDEEIKSIDAFEIKDADKGEVMAVVNTLNVVDRDGDVILPGAIPNGAKVKLSAYGHGTIKNGEAPVGKGIVTIEGDKAVFRGNYFLSTQRGRDAFETVKALGGDSEWSIGFNRTKSEAPDEEWKAKGARRMLKSLNLLEVSPVFLGANGMTGTVAVKEADEAAAKAAAEEAETAAKAAAELKALNEQAAEQFERFQRTMRRLSA